MAEVGFDRNVFVGESAPQARPLVQLLSPLLVVMAMALVCYVGYKVYLVNEHTSEVAAANAQVQQLEQELSEMQKRVDTLEKHRKAAPVEPSSTGPAANAPAPSKPPRTVYHIAAASALPPQPKPAAPAPAPATSPASSSQTLNAEVAGQLAANHEAWEATTNRLADVVGVVGTQQSEISATRDAVNQLLAQTHRKAVSFELDRGTSRIPVGPVTMQFKSADTKAQHYTLCVFFNDEKCIALKDRALNEVVVFVVAKDGPPLELVATKIQHDQIVGYLAIPSAIE
jgi:Tfp pilus assembly protein PilE